MATAGKLAYIFPGNAYRKRLLVVRAIEPMEPDLKNFIDEVLVPMLVRDVMRETRKNIVAPVTIDMHNPHRGRP
jgi:hypothetical protein